jgi:hypothetical protein
MELCSLGVQNCICDYTSFVSNEFEIFQIKSYRCATCVSESGHCFSLANDIQSLLTDTTSEKAACRHIQKSVSTQPKPIGATRQVAFEYAQPEETKHS